MLDYFHIIHGLYYTCWLPLWPVRTYKHNVERLLLNHEYWRYLHVLSVPYLMEYHARTKLFFDLPLPTPTAWYKCTLGRKLKYEDLFGDDVNLDELYRQFCQRQAEEAGSPDGA